MNPHLRRLMKIVLASQSQIKITAVIQALEKNSAHALLTSIEVDSGVPMQPINDETLQGARNRLIAAKQRCPDADVYIAIENGLFFENDSAPYVDKAIIVVSTRGGNELIAESDAVQFPAELADMIEKTRKIGFTKTTIGKELVRLGKIQKHDDLHLSLFNKSRVEFLTEILSRQMHIFLQQDVFCTQPSEEQPLVIDDNVLCIVKRLENNDQKISVEDYQIYLNQLIQTLDKNLAKPAVYARYAAYQQAQDNDLELVRNMKRYPVDGEGYAVAFSPLENETDFWNCWSTYGFVVGKEVISKDVCEQTIMRIKQIAQELSQDKFSIDEPATYEHIPVDANNTPLISRGFFEIYHDNMLAQLRQSLRIYIHHVVIWGKTNLWATFDRLGVKLQNHKDSLGLPLHVDQNPMVQKQFETLQGVLALTDCPLERGTYAAVPGSLHAFKEYEKVVQQHERENYRGEYVELKNNPPQEAVLQENKQAIPLRSGDMVSWDSRTTHANTPNLSGKPRMVAYISARPAPQQNREALISERRNGFFSGLGKNVREAGMHASMKPRFTNSEAINKVREPEVLNPLGELLYGLK